MVAGAPATLRGLPLGFLTGDAVLAAAVNADGSGCSMLLLWDASDVLLALLCALQTISSSIYVNRHSLFSPLFFPLSSQGEVRVEQV